MLIVNLSHEVSNVFVWLVVTEFLMPKGHSGGYLLKANPLCTTSALGSAVAVDLGGTAF